MSGNSSPPVVWTMLFMVWHVFMDSEDLDSAQSSSTWTNVTFFYWFLNVVTRNFRMLRGGSLILGGNKNGYQVAEHRSTKSEVNPWMLSTLKKSKSIWSINPGGNFETLMDVTLVILFALVKRQRWKSSSKSGIFVGRPFVGPFTVIFLILVIETQPKR